MRVKPSGMLDDDPLDHVGHVLARIDRVLEERVEVLPLDDLDRVVAVREQCRDRLARDPITVVLEPMDLDPMGADVLEALELLERANDLLALLHDDRRLLAGGLGRRIDLVEEAGVGHLLDEVEDVVEAADQLVNVLAVERRDERVLELLTDVVAQTVTLALEIAQLAREPLALVVRAEELVEQSRAGQDVVGVVDEELEEFLL